jgi:large subunit ribosomal protein L6|tara:strand:+ start:27 stop:572 length:546 start_codon:yes stop_codon:yes gene_type:complete
MSRIGKNPIIIPSDVKVKFEENSVIIDGPKGSLIVSHDSSLKMKYEDNTLTIERPTDSRTHKALHGTTRQLVFNAVQGTKEGFTKELEIRGVGYQASNQGKYIVLQLGYSHDIYFEPPEGIIISANKTEITINGINKQLVGEVAAKIRSFRKPEPYKGKGIRYKDEYVISKQGKTVGGSGS